MASSGLVVDASVVAKWFLRDEDLVAETDALASEWEDGRWNLVAPGHFPFEVAGAILRARRNGRLRGPVAEDALIAFTGLIEKFEFLAPRFLTRDGAALAGTLGVNFFDACYLQAARVQGTHLVTADAAFYRQAGSQPDVIWLGDYM